MRNCRRRKQVILQSAVYLLLLLIGSIGFVAMTLLGMSHGGSTHGALGGHGHAGGLGHGGGHAQVGSHGHALPGGHGSAAKGPIQPAKTGGQSLAGLLLLSPLDIFSLCLGAGLAGMALQAVFSAAMLPWIAAVGALIFCFGIERPFLSFAMKFVSKPCEGLEGVVARTAVAVTGFDNEGRGLVKVSVDDQTVQVLAMLDPAELHRGVIVHKGDEVVVTEVDPAKNTCRVTKELSE